ncbi:hypothetical protein CKO33_12330 [Ectothiorhodospira mobilis]|nr:hypothetical protein [Ectothiorhodospira mobilis]
MPSGDLLEGVVGQFGLLAQPPQGLAAGLALAQPIPSAQGFAQGGVVDLAGSVQTGIEQPLRLRGDHQGQFVNEGGRRLARHG